MASDRSSSTSVTDTGLWQGSLFGHQQPALTALSPHRVWLDDDCWLDRQANWLLGGDRLFRELEDELPWQSGRRPMYDRMVDIPRLSAFLAASDERLPRVVARASAALETHYATPFLIVGVNYYRTGRDSVAWHADRIGRLEHNPIIVIVSVGGRRNFRLRPMGGGTGVTIPMYSGDLLVMGGACQHRWEHAVPKSRTTEPRMSITFRHRDGRADDDPLTRFLSANTVAGDPPDHST